MDEFPTCFTAAGLVKGCAFGALDKQEMTAGILAVNMSITGLSALMAARDDLFPHPFPHAVVKHKIFSAEFIFQAFFLYHIGVVNDTSFQVENISESLVKEVGTGLLTTDATCAIHDDVAVPFILQHFCRHGQLLPESVR